MRLFILFLLIGLGSLVSQAQSQTLSLRGGLSSVRGEATKDWELMQMGAHYGVVYAQAWYHDDEQWQWLVKFSGNQDQINYAYQDSAAPYQARISSSALFCGIRYYPGFSINRYTPYFGQILPYLSVYPGVLLAHNNILSSHDFQFPFRTLELNLAFAFDLEVGLQMTLNKDWRLGWYLSRLWSSSDYLDGIKGHTNLNDILVKSGLELTYRFN